MEEYLEWEQCYQAGNTPWDKGAPAPVLMQVVRRDPAVFKQARVLVPGCGIGWDARYLAPHAKEVVAIDIASTAVARARELDQGGTVKWELLDLFALPPQYAAAFDIVWEHTCLCALEPAKRSAYATAVKSCLRPGGQMYGVFYLEPDLDPGETGPPFKISKEEVTTLWESMGMMVMESWVPDVAFEGREGRELFLRAQKNEANQN